MDNKGIEELMLVVFQIIFEKYYSHFMIHFRIDLLTLLKKHTIDSFTDRLFSQVRIIEKSQKYFLLLFIISGVESISKMALMA